MRKSLLIIDTPEDCQHCPVSYTSTFGELICGKSHQQVPRRTIPNDCQLVPVPEKKNRARVKDNTDIRRIRGNMFVQGWNACIDAIGGKK